MLATMAMLSLTLMGLGSNAITPALATLAAQFPNQDVSIIQTVATLSMMAGSLIAGAVMGKKIKTKTLAILGSILCLIFGILPAFLTSYNVDAFIITLRLHAWKTIINIPISNTVRTFSFSFGCIFFLYF